jgi:hypothetical protein
MQTLEDGTESYFSAANYNLEGSQLATVSIQAGFLQEKFKEPNKQAINPDNNHHHTNGVFFLLYPSLGFFSVESHGGYVSSSFEWDEKKLEKNQIV